MNHYVYMIINKINGKKYIGKRSCKKSIEEDNYMGSGKYLLRAINKYGIENFEKIILEICDSEKTAFEKEKMHIEKVKAYDSDEYYNIAMGGKGFSSEESKRLWQDENIKKVKSQQSRDLWNNEEYRRKHVEYATIQMTNMWKDEKYRNIFIEQAKLRMTPERKALMSLELKDLWKDDEYRYKMENINKIPVILLNNLMIFNSAKDACSFVNLIYPSSITDCCNKKVKSAGKINGYPARWMYLSNFVLIHPDEMKSYLQDLHDLNNGSYIYKDTLYNPLLNSISNDNLRKYVCLNDSSIHLGLDMAGKYVGLSAFSGISACCLRKRKYAGKIDGEKAVWAFYEDYIKMSKSEIQELIDMAQTKRKTNNRQVICLNNGLKFNSALEASKYIGLKNGSSISRCCLGKIEYAGKINGEPAKWKFYEE